MALTLNKDLDYITKDFDSTVDALIAFANVNYGQNTSANRLWTNFNADSFSRNWLEIVAYVSDVFFFYFDNQATQSYLQTATIRGAVEDIAKQFGFSLASATSSSGVATFSVTGSGTINRGFRVSATNGEEFFTVNNTTVVGAGTVNIDVLQGIRKEEQFIAEGLQNEEFELQGPNVVKDRNNVNPNDVSPQVIVNGNSYTLVNSFIRFNGQDSPAIFDSLGNVIGGGGRVFTLEERDNGTPFIKFGDGIFGKKLQVGDGVQVLYRSGGGSAGNIAEQSLTTLVNTNPIVSSVTNNFDFSGGADDQSIEQLRELIPASLKTLDRAVAEKDYSDILITNFSEVFAASTEKNVKEAGIDLNIYVVPQGTGVSKISENNLLVNRLAAFLDRRKTVTIQFAIRDAFEVQVLISLEVFISNTSSKATVESSIKTALINYFSLSTGGANESGIGFSEDILLKDINNIVQEIVGVERFEIKRLTYRPRMEKEVAGLTTNYNSNDIKVFPNVTESEWLLVASGSEDEAIGTVLFNNDSSTGFSYNSSNGEITYNFPVDLDPVSPGDSFRDGAGADFTIFSVNAVSNKVTVLSGLSINTTPSPGVGGSIRNGETDFQSFKVFKKTLATATNLSINNITDNNLNLSVEEGIGTAISARKLIDNDSVYVPNQYSNGNFFLVDSADNIWEIEENSSNVFKTSINAINDPSVATVGSGAYKIVPKLTSGLLTFQNTIFTIQYNTDKTIFSIGAQFSQIGTIGDSFEIAILQNRKGNLGVGLDLIEFNSTSKNITLNGNPNLKGVNSSYVLLDSDGQIFNITSVDDVPKPSVFYDEVYKDTSVVIKSSDLGTQYSQGFKVSSSNIYSVISFYLRREGNVVGNLTARIVDDDGSGLPDLTSVVAVSNTLLISSLEEDFSEVSFSFNSPPTLAPATQYHLVINADAAYNSSFQEETVIYTEGSISYDFTDLGGNQGNISYTSAINLSNVVPGNYFKDNSNNLFKILAVDDDSDLLLIDTNSTTVDDSGNNSGVIANDRVSVSIDTDNLVYGDGEFSAYNGTSSLWSNSTQGPSAGNFTDIDGASFSEARIIFSVKGTKNIVIDSNLTPTMGPGATITTRYYDDNNEISLILGITEGVITSAPDANALGTGTVSSVADSPIDNFVFRTSRYADDVVNLRQNEIPQLSEDNISIQLFGGTE